MNLIFLVMIVRIGIITRERARSLCVCVCV